MGPTSFQVTQHNDSDANILKPLTTVLFKTSDTVSGKMLAPMMLCLLVLMRKLRGGARLPSEVNTDGLDVIPGIDKCDVGMAFARERCCIVFSRPSATREQLCQLNDKTHRPSGSVWFVVARRVAVFVDAVVPRIDASCRRSCWRASYGRGRM
ncbi:MAG: hypothetical protein MHM6MM_007307 [Cercozoa sp. M6MM]